MTRESNISLDDMIQHRHRFIIRDKDGILYDGSFKSKDDLFIEFNKQIRKTDFDNGTIQQLFGSSEISNIDYVLYSRLPKIKQIDDVKFDFIFNQ